MIVVDELIPLLPEFFGDTHTVLQVPGRQITNALLRSYMPDALFVRSTTQVNAALLAGTGINFVGSATAGIDHVDVDWLNENGIHFTHAPASNAWAVAEYVLAWILALKVRPPACVGIIGHGNVGMRLDQALTTLGYSTLVYDPPKYGHPVSTLYELLTQSDVVTLHVPLTSIGMYPTKGMLTRTELMRLKHGAILIQTSRGGVVDDEVVAECIASKEIRAVLDVYETEPNVSADLINDVRYCTPHIAGYSRQAKHNGALMVARAYLQHIGATENLNVVTSPLPTLEHSIHDLLEPSKLSLRDVVAEAQWFTEAYVQQPGSDQFDALRKAYEPRDEVLSALMQEPLA